jgi:metal-responsive CopG/Arc/MetJ family transcriptional regulator
MAHEQADSTPRHNALISTRIDEELVVEIDAFAKDNDITRSQAVRVLICTALREKPVRTAARECVLEFEAIKRRLLEELGEKLKIAMPGVIKTITREDIRS